LFVLPLSDNGDETFPLSCNNFDSSVRNNASDALACFGGSMAGVNYLSPQTPRTVRTLHEPFQAPRWELHPGTAKQREASGGGRC